MWPDAIETLVIVVLAKARVDVCRQSRERLEFFGHVKRMTTQFRKAFDFFAERREHVWNLRDWEWQVARVNCIEVSVCSVE